MDNTKTLVQGIDFTFDASAQTVTFAGFTPVQAQILVISNVTDNIIIYSSSQPATKGVLSGQVLTLTYDTTTMADSDNLQVRYASTDAQPISAAALPLPTGAATSAKQDTIIVHVDGIETALTTLNAKDFATQTTLAALLAKVIAAPSTEAKQDAMIVLLTSIAGYVDGLEGKDYATQTTLAALLAKVIASPSTEAKQDTIIAAVDTLEASFTTLNAKDFATQTTLAAILAKIIAAPATEAKQDTLIASNAAIQTAVQTLDNAIAGAEMQVDIVTSALPTGASTSALQTTGNTALSAIQTAVQLIDNAISGNEMQVDVITLPSIPAGTNNIGDVDVLTLPALAAGTNIIGQVNVAPQTTGGLSLFRSIDLDETEEEVKGTAGQVYGWFIYNNAATVLYVKFYNATAANVTVGTTTPVLTIPIPAGSGANVEYTNGIAFSTAITIAATTGVADNNTGAPAANDIIANIFYK